MSTPERSIWTVSTRRGSLKRLYADLNRRFFDGHLPAYSVRRAPLADPWMNAVRDELRRVRGQRPAMVSSNAYSSPNSRAALP